MAISKTKQGAYQKLDKEVVDNLMESIIIEAHTTEESILALFTKQNPQWPAFLISRQTGIPQTTIGYALRQLVKTGRLTVQNGVIRHEGKRVPVKLYSKI